MNRDLYVGDLHAQVNNLADTERLLSFIRDTFIQAGCRNLVFLGDIFHTHSVIRQEVAYAMKSFFRDFYYNAVQTQKNRIIIISGNHDGISPTITAQNALDLILGEYATIISGNDYLVGDDGFVFMPFVHDQEEFLKTALLAKTSAENKHSDPILVCHQTFDGAAYESGMLCPDGIKSDLLPYSVIISGHIHKRQVVNDKVLYLGTPRAVTAAEVNDEKFIFLVGRTETGVVSISPVSTKDMVKNYYLVEVSEDDNSLVDLSHVNINKDDLRIRITGSEAFYDKAKEHFSYLKGKAKLIPNIKRDLSKKVSLESSNLSIDLALEKYVKEVADLNEDMREEVWQTISKML